jgi:hypothetical protein
MLSLVVRSATHRRRRIGLSLSDLDAAATVTTVVQRAGACSTTRRELTTGRACCCSRGATSARRRARICSVERPSRWATSEASWPLAAPALNSASSRGDQGLDRRRGAIPSVCRRATRASGERASRPATCSTGSWSAIAGGAAGLRLRSSALPLLISSGNWVRGSALTSSSQGAGLMRFVCGRSRRLAR